MRDEIIVKYKDDGQSKSYSELVKMINEECDRLELPNFSKSADFRKMVMEPIRSDLSFVRLGGLQKALLSMTSFEYTESGTFSLVRFSEISWEDVLLRMRQIESIEIE